jgi:hypothetical protein
MANRVDIGHGVSIELRTIVGESSPAGAAYWHPHGADVQHEGWIPFKDAKGWPATGWEVVSLVPLTLSPSLLCRTCGHHGFIREGKWVPA